MEFTINTSKLQSMVTRSVKGASNNKLIPLTGLLGIKCENGKLVLTTTDATNYLYIIDDDGYKDEFNIAVPVDIFAKLISRTTSEKVKFQLVDNSLVVVGNGTYTIELPMDEEGELVKYPDPMAKFDGGSVQTINLSVVNTIIGSLKSALAVSIDDSPIYTGYYIGNRVVSTDTYKIASMAVKLFDRSTLLGSETMDLLSAMSTEKIDVMFNDNIIVFKTPDCVVYGIIMEGIDEYAIDPISELIDAEFDSMCKVSKIVMLQVLDRLSLFVNTFDRNGIYLTFTKDGINVSSKSSSGVEVIPYIESKGFKSFTCCIDIENLISQIKSQASDIIEVYYGLDNAIKMVDGNVTHIMAFLDDDRLAEG